jgi:peptidoglycan/xylan/chitin deacetylase (PgdA/CDA1 family)
MQLKRLLTRFSLMVLLLLGLNLTAIDSLPLYAQSQPFEPAPNPQAAQLFRQEWNRVDGPVQAGQTNRSWLWGPGPFSGFSEEYREAQPGGKRYVMYFDKARMELTDPQHPTPSYGLLVTELLSGNLQLDDNQYVAAPGGAANLSIAGDEGNWLTYARLKPYASLQGDNRAVDLTGQTVNWQLTEAQGLQTATEYERGQAQTLAYYEPTLGHNIPQVFWEYLNRKGVVYYGATGSYGQGQPLNWLNVVGYPLTEAYWVRQRVGGVDKDILIQAFQRRTLTFTPSNSPAFQVEMGNVGRQYAEWRYGHSFGANQQWSSPPLNPQGLSEVLRGKTGKKQVAITLDAGSTAVAFPKEIAALDKYQIKITFFLTGRWVLENPAYARYIATDQMEIANHTYSHPDLTTLSDTDVREEVTKGASAIELVTGQNPLPLFRFPYGARDSRVMRVVNELGYRSVYWTYDSLDSVGLPKSAEFLISRITGLSDSQLDGAIILMHLGNLTSGEALGPILENLTGRGFKVVTISELVSDS